MDSKELRIGNKTSNGIVVNIFEDHFFTKVGDTVYSSKYHNANPIPLTEEWLLKFGFKKYSKNEFELATKDFDISFFNGELKLLCGFYAENPISLNNQKYVHQLQNLYFALTGEELTLKN
jgi:hypothetical protein